MQHESAAPQSGAVDSRGSRRDRAHLDDARAPRRPHLLCRLQGVDCSRDRDLENARRNAALSARQNYLLVSNGIALISALEQALVSSQSAVDSNKLGYEVGVRINIDVLNAQQQLFSTRRALALARYQTIVNSLRLKSTAGALREEDLEEVNRALAP